MRKAWAVALAVGIAANGIAQPSQSKDDAVRVLGEFLPSVVVDFESHPFRFQTGEFNADTCRFVYSGTFLSGGKATFVLEFSKVSEVRTKGGYVLLASPSHVLKWRINSAAVAGKLAEAAETLRRECDPTRLIASAAGATSAGTGQNSVTTAQPAVTSAAIKRGPRVALVLGNGRYGGSLGALSNPANDARLVAAALRSAGFDVELVLDADQRGMKLAISRLGNRTAAAGAGSTALFYYAGHGIQSKGTNYLVPVGANLTNEADLELDAVAADTVLAQMETAGSATNIVILDACRNMPLGRGTRSGTRGLARTDAPVGSFLAYSTAPGQEAVDGTGSNSPFAKAFADEVAKPGQPIQIVFQNVRQQVYQATGRKQTPWDSSSLFETFYFQPGG